MHEGVNLLKKVFNESCSVTSKTPYRIQSDFSYDLQVERYSMHPAPPTSAMQRPPRSV